MLWYSLLRCLFCYFVTYVWLGIVLLFFYDVYWFCWFWVCYFKYCILVWFVTYCFGWLLLCLFWCFCLSLALGILMVVCWFTLLLIAGFVVLCYCGFVAFVWVGNSVVILVMICYTLFCVAFVLMSVVDLFAGYVFVCLWLFCYLNFVVVCFGCVWFVVYLITWIWVLVCCFFV